MTTTTKTFTCCDKQRLAIDETLGYKCFMEGDTLMVDTFSTNSSGYENLCCLSCGADFDISEIEQFGEAN